MSKTTENKPQDLAEAYQQVLWGDKGPQVLTDAEIVCFGREYSLTERLKLITTKPELQDVKERLLQEALQLPKVHPDVAKFSEEDGLFLVLSSRIENSRRMAELQKLAGIVESAEDAAAFSQAEDTSMTPRMKELCKLAGIE
jgi:hypothetical protein